MYVIYYTHQAYFLVTWFIFI